MGKWADGQIILPEKLEEIRRFYAIFLCENYLPIRPFALISVLSHWYPLNLL